MWAARNFYFTSLLVRSPKQVIILNFIPLIFKLFLPQPISELRVTWSLYHKDSTTCRPLNIVEPCSSDCVSHFMFFFLVEKGVFPLPLSPYGVLLWLALPSFIFLLTATSHKYPHFALRTWLGDQMRIPRVVTTSSFFSLPFRRRYKDYRNPSLV